MRKQADPGIVRKGGKGKIKKESSWTMDGRSCVPLATVGLVLFDVVGHENCGGPGISSRALHVQCSEAASARRLRVEKTCMRLEVRRPWLARADLRAL